MFVPDACVVVHPIVGVVVEVRLAVESEVGVTHARRILIGPLADDGSTTAPCCVITTSPEATSRRAADRAGSISDRQSSGSTTLAASLGQIVAPPDR